MTRGAPRSRSHAIAASMSAVAVPLRRPRSSTTTSWTKPQASRSSFHEMGSSAGVDVADDLALLLGDEDHDVVVLELLAEKPGVAVRGIGAGDP